MCEFLIFNAQKRYEKQKHFGNFSATFWKFSNFSATFWQLLDTFIGKFFGIHRQLVAKPNQKPTASLSQTLIGAFRQRICLKGVVWVPFFFGGGGNNVDLARKYTKEEKFWT